MKRLVIFIIFTSLSISIPAQNIDLSGTNSLISQSIFSVLKEAYSFLDISICSTILPAERALIMSNSGLMDGEVNRLNVIEELYHNLIRVDVPLMTINMVGVSRIGDKNSINKMNWENLRVGIRRGSKISEIITKNIQNLSLVNDYDQLFSMLEMNRIDLIIVSDWEFQIRLKNGSISEMDKVHLFNNPYHHYHYLHSRHSNLVPEIETVLQQMKDSGRVENLLKGFEIKPIISR